MAKKKSASEFSEAFAKAVDNLPHIVDVNTKVSWLRGFKKLVSLKAKHSGDIARAFELTLSDDNDPKVKDAAIEFAASVIRRKVMGKSEVLHIIEQVTSSTSDTYEKACNVFSEIKVRSAEEDLHLLDTLWSTHPDA